jgi:hypothetical protein
MGFVKEKASTDDDAAVSNKAVKKNFMIQILLLVNTKLS